MDLIDGKASSWQDYVAAGVGGAAGGVAATTCGPMCVGAVSGAAQDLTKQALTKGIKDIDLNQTANSAATGAILGKAGQLGGKVVVAAGSKITSKIPPGVKGKIADSASKFAQGTTKYIPNSVKNSVGKFGEAAKKNLGFGKGGGKPSPPSSTPTSPHSNFNAKPKPPSGEKIHGHHSDPKFMGGDPKQKLTDLAEGEHKSLHQKMNDFLVNVKDAAGNHMRPQREIVVRRSKQTSREKRD